VLGVSTNATICVLQKLFDDRRAWRVVDKNLADTGGEVDLLAKVVAKGTRSRRHASCQRLASSCESRVKKKWRGAPGQPRQRRHGPSAGVA